MTILIVDHNLEFSNLLGTTVRFLGFEADFAVTGAEALQCRMNRHYDAILLSLDLPDYDGYSTAQAIRQLELSSSGYQPSLICGLMHLCKDATRESCLSNGFDTCTVKPKTTRDTIELLVSLRKDSGRCRRRKPVQRMVQAVACNAV
jgi:CheY-like chemotaxis protein